MVGYAVFGIHGIDLVAALNRDAAFVSTDSFPTELAHLVGKPGVFPIDHDLLKGGLVVIIGYLLWRTWRGYDWIAASGWTLLAISVTSTWLLPWYTLWSLPLAVVVRDRRLLAATLAVQGAVHRPPDGSVAGACRDERRCDSLAERDSRRRWPLEASARVDTAMRSGAVRDGAPPVGGGDIADSRGSVAGGCDRQRRG